MNALGTAATSLRAKLGESRNSIQRLTRPPNQDRATTPLPEIRAAIELKDHPDKALELLASTSAYERAFPEVSYLRGLAYLRLHMGLEAAAEFRKVMDHKGANWGATWQHANWGQYYSLSYLGLAHGSALAGDTPRAKKAFQDFFTLWKDADPDIPILQQARADYARLQ